MVGDSVCVSWNPPAKVIAHNEAMSLDTNRHPVQEWDSFSPDKNCCRRQREGGKEGGGNEPETRSAEERGGRGAEGEGAP